jgi:large subunit ribosomal protein L32
MTNCPHTEVTETPRATGPHYSDLRCKACGKHMGFGKSPESKARTAKRRTHDALTPVAFGECPQCHEPKLSHQVCAHCGFYRGRQVREVKEG